MTSTTKTIHARFPTQEAAWSFVRSAKTLLLGVREPKQVATGSYKVEFSCHEASRERAVARAFEAGAYGYAV